MASLGSPSLTPFDTYNALLEGIGEIISAGKDLSSQARGRRLARRNWEIGDAIHTHLLANEGKSAYGEGLFDRLADDVNLDKSTVYLMLRFRRGMPNPDHLAEITEPARILRTRRRPLGLDRERAQGADQK